MEDTHPVLLSALAGFVCALAFAAIPGPINLTILNEGAQRGFRWAFLIGLGASVMDSIYCAISFTGFSTFFYSEVVKASMQVFTFVFLLYLGFKFLLAETVNVPTKLDHASEKIEARLEEKLHPHSAFMTGFVRVLGNLGVLLAWVIWSAFLMAHDWVADTLPARSACVGGVFTGALTWFVILSYGISRGHGKFSVKTMLRLQHFSGICLILAGIFAGGNIIWHLVHHHAKL
jgi:threonine/homoserine/homoserine lactone efflux protein